MNVPISLDDLNCFYFRVPISRIDMEDESFAINSFTSRERLNQSFGQTGILFPPWLLERGEDRYIIVDGFKRLRWLYEKKQFETTCLIFPKACSRSQLLLLRVEGKLAGPPMNAAEKARIISMVGRFFPLEFIIDRLLPLLSIPPRHEEVERWSALASSGDGLLEAAASETISDRVAIELAKWDLETREEVVLLFKSLRCSASIQAEIVERIEGIARVQGRAKIEILNKSSIKSILNEPRSNHRQKTQSIRDLLAGWASPRLKAREERFARAVRDAYLPGSLHLVHPPAFEGERWQLQLDFSTPENLLALLDTADEFARSPILPRIMSPESDDQ